jgi:hypothetical protein
MPATRTLIAATLLATFACGPGTSLGARADEADAAGGPVVLELFTSQGCSSCPPADRLLTRLGSDPQLSTRVFPLSFHVDYWNYIGWTDPFSSAKWSSRQRRYARTFESQRVYTPQLVVNGREEGVGSKEGEVEDMVHRALGRPAAAKLHVQLAPGSDPGQLRAQVQAQVVEPPQDASGKPLDLMVALYEKDLTTSVERGENASRTLRNDYVVRVLEDAGKLAPQGGAGMKAEVVFDLDPSWKVRDLGVVAFLQDPRTGAVYGAARATLAVIE